MDGVAGTYTTQCLDDMDVVTCNSGKINASLSATPGDTALFDKATCVHGMWFGTSCTGAGSGYFISAAAPFFNCPDVVPPTTTPLITTTTPTVPTVPTTTPKAPVILPCACAYTDAGAALNLAAPVSFCADKVQKLQCDGKISATTGGDFAEYDSVSCTNGLWSGTGCDGVTQPLNIASVTVKCASEEPPVCAYFPHTTEGLKYIGTVNGVQRYTCEGDKLAKHTISGDTVMAAKYIECSRIYVLKYAFDQIGHATPANTPIDKIECRDYGKVQPSCAVPMLKNAWYQDGKLRCIKGTYLKSVGIAQADNARIFVNASDWAMTDATCGESGWKVTGTPHTAVELIMFLCEETPASMGTCGELDIPRRNVQHTTLGANYFCWDALMTQGALRLEAITPTGEVYSGFRFQCVPKSSGPSILHSCARDGRSTLTPALFHPQFGESSSVSLGIPTSIAHLDHQEEDPGRILIVSCDLRRLLREFTLNHSGLRRLDDLLLGSSHRLSATGHRQQKAQKIPSLDPIPPGSKLSCEPFQTTVLPPFPTSLPLIPVGVGSAGLTRWACIDSTLKIDLELGPGQIERYPLHSPYIETNNTFYQVISSVELMPSGKFNQTIISISCEDMGSKEYACTDPVDLGGIRVGNQYECMKGFYLMTAYWIDAAGARQSHDASTTDSKGLQCKRDGWAVEGTAFSALNIINVHCYPAHALGQAEGNCPENIDTEHYKLQFDSFRKYFTCYAGESLAYTLGGVRTYGAGKKLFCGTNTTTSAREWQWSLMDGTGKAAIPLGAKMNCF
uniref:Uncharacterized protein n=1 Tax=Pristionchus pacificus TaxID=54126 RepID=A0A8R1UQQ6_PRIPA